MLGAVQVPGFDRTPHGIFGLQWTEFPAQEAALCTITRHRAARWPRSMTAKVWIQPLTEENSNFA